MMMESVPEVVPLELTEIAVIEPVIDPEPVIEVVPVVETVPVAPIPVSVPEEIAEIIEPTNPAPTTIDADRPRLFIPDGLPIDDAPLPPEIQRFAPWTWSWMEIMGIGLTIGAIVSALSWLLWSVAQ